MPSEVTGKPSPFDRFATATSAFTSEAWFFALCVTLVVLWAPSFFLFGNVDTWQLVINTATTIVTFLLVALLQNTQSRANDALQHKLNAIAEGLANLMSHHAETADNRRLRHDLSELRQAIGLEDKENS